MRHASGYTRDASGYMRDASGYMRDASGYTRDASGYMHDSIVQSSFVPIEDSFFESSSTADYLVSDPFFGRRLINWRFELRPHE